MTINDPVQSDHHRMSPRRWQTLAGGRNCRLKPGGLAKVRAEILEVLCFILQIIMKTL